AESAAHDIVPPVSAALRSSFLSPDDRSARTAAGEERALSWTASAPDPTRPGAGFRAVYRRSGLVGGRLHFAQTISVAMPARVGSRACAAGRTGRVRKTIKHATTQSSDHPGGNCPRRFRHPEPRG